MKPDPEDRSALAAQLGLLSPGFLPKPLFRAVARLVVTPTLVAVPLFRRNGQTRILLTRRAEDDEDYAGQLHPPGTVLLATDDSLESVFQRLLRSELPNLRPISPPVFVMPFFDSITRGRELALVHFVEIDEPGISHQTFEPHTLPDNVIATDVPRIQAACAAFERRLSEGG